MVQPIRASEYQKWIFLLKWPKCPWLALGLIRRSNLVLTLTKWHFSHFLLQTRVSQRFLATLIEFDPKLILDGSKNPNFDLATRTGWNQWHYKDYRILVPTNFHGSKLELQQPIYHENRNDAPIVAPQTFESHNFWSDHWIFEFHTFIETENQDLSKGVKISLIRWLLRPFNGRCLDFRARGYK